MKINSKNSYTRARVMIGLGPHQMLKMAQEKALGKESKERISKEGNYSKIKKNIYRGEKMSIRSLDQCTCGHNREKHDNFDSECEECKCEVFHRNIRIKNMPVE